MRPNKLRELLKAGKPSVGTHLHISWASVAELVGRTGHFDYIEFVAESSRQARPPLGPSSGSACAPNVWLLAFYLLMTIVSNSIFVPVSVKAMGEWAHGMSNTQAIVCVSIASIPPQGFTVSGFL